MISLSESSPEKDNDARVQHQMLVMKEASRRENDDVRLLHHMLVMKEASRVDPLQTQHPDAHHTISSQRQKRMQKKRMRKGSSKNYAICNVSIDLVSVGVRGCSCGCSEFLLLPVPLLSQSSTLHHLARMRTATPLPVILCCPPSCFKRRLIRDVMTRQRERLRASLVRTSVEQ